MMDNVLLFVRRWASRGMVWDRKKEGGTLIVGQRGAALGFKHMKR